MRLLLIILLLMTSQQTFALLSSSGGGMATGGGSGVVCRDQYANIQSVELLDLYEARVHQRLLVSSTGDAEQDYIDSVLRVHFLQAGPARGIAPLSISDIKFHYKNIFEVIRWTSPGVKIPLLKDQGSIEVLPQNCALEQIAIFHDGNDRSPEFIEMQTDLWERLPALHKAALIWHELLYKYYRLLKDLNSELTRVEVANAFAAKITPILEGLPSSAVACSASDPSGNQISNFFVFPQLSSSGKSQWIVQFKQILGRPLITKTFAVLDKKFPQLSSKRKQIGRSNTSTSFQVVEMNEQSSRQKVSLLGGMNWELTIEWQADQPIAFSVHKNGRNLGQVFVSGCY